MALAFQWEYNKIPKQNLQKHVKIFKYCITSKLDAISDSEFNVVINDDYFTQIIPDNSQHIN